VTLHGLNAESLVSMLHPELLVSDGTMVVCRFIGKMDGMHRPCSTTFTCGPQQGFLAKAHVAMTWLSIMGWLVDLFTDQDLSAENARLVASFDVLRIRFRHPSIFLELVLDDSKDGNVELAGAFFRMLREAQGASWMAPDSCTMAAPSESVEWEG